MKYKKRKKEGGYSLAGKTFALQAHVTGSTPVTSIIFRQKNTGKVAKWLTAVVLKTTGQTSFIGSNPIFLV